MNHRTLYYKELRTDLSRKLFCRATKAGYQFRNQSHWGAFKRGYIACRDDLPKRACPYEDPPRKCTYRRGYRTWWLLGYHFAQWTARPDIHKKPIQLPPKTNPGNRKAALIVKAIPKDRNETPCL